LSSSSDYNYYQQGGWSSYDFKGVTRHCFYFQDTTTKRKMVHAGNYPTMGGYQDWSEGASYLFAGIIVIKKGSWDSTARKFKA